MLRGYLSIPVSVFFKKCYEGILNFVKGFLIFTVFFSPLRNVNVMILIDFWGAWVAQLVRRPTLAQVTISWFVGLSPALGSVLTAQSLEPASDSVSPSLSAPPMLMLCLSLSIINVKKKFF